jgi:cytochrome P450
MSREVLQFHTQTLRSFVFTVIAADVVVPTGSSVVICIQHVHMDPEHFPEPHKFIPERFLPDNKRRPFSYLPFSAGPRNCIGTFIRLSWLRFVILFGLLKYATIFLLHQYVRFSR